MLFILVLAAMLVVSGLYFNEFGWVTVLKFWGAWMLGFVIAFLPVGIAGALAMAWQALVATVFLLKAKLA